MEPLVIYHKNCADGFGAAWAVRHLIGKDYDYHAASHGEAPPDVTGRDVIIVDFSYKRPVLLEMAEKAQAIIIIDHHKSAQEDLVDLPSNIEVNFNMERSGAVMAWDYFNRHSETMPTLLAHIQDRDLWRFELPGTKEIQLAVFSYPYDFEVWDMLVLHTEIDQLYLDGVSLNRKHMKDVDEIVAAASHRVDIGEFNVPAVNVPYFYASEVGHKLCQGEPFAVTYYSDGENLNFSLRSDKNGLDVSKVAATFGGGGHKNAAGFRVAVVEMVTGVGE